MSTIAQALEYYDQGQAKYKELYDQIKYYKVTIIKFDQGRNKITFYDADMKLLFESDYELIGELINHSWSWSWSLSNYSKNTTYLMRKVLMYALDLTHDSQLPDILELKHLLLTNKHNITNYITLEIFVALYSYLLKMPFIIPLLADKHSVEEIVPWVPLNSFEIATDTRFILFLNLLNNKDDINLNRTNPGSISSLHT